MKKQVLVNNWCMACFGYSVNPPILYCSILIRSYETDGYKCLGSAMLAVFYFAEERSIKLIHS